MHLFVHSVGWQVLTACLLLSYMGKERPGIISPGVDCELTHDTVCPVGRRRAGGGAVVVCATTMEGGHRRKTGIDVCWGVWWIALQQGRKRSHIQSNSLVSSFSNTSFKTLHSAMEISFQNFKIGKHTSCLDSTAFVFQITNYTDEHSWLGFASAVEAYNGNEGHWKMIMTSKPTSDGLKWSPRL